MSREDQYNVTVSVTRIGQPVRDFGTFDTFDGGDVDSEETKYHPGGLADQVSLGGRRTVNNVTVGRLFTLDRDLQHMGWLFDGVGKADVVVTKQSIDVDGNASGAPLVYSGKLKSVTPPSHDSESSDAARWEMEISSATVTQNV